MIILPEKLIQKSNQIEHFVASHLASLDHDILGSRPDPKSWSILEVIEHLNLTFKIYGPQLEQQFKQCPPYATEKPDLIRASWLKGQFIRSMEPRSGKRKWKMKTFKSLEPRTELDTNCISLFLNNQKSISHWVKESRNLEVSKVKIISAIGPILTFGWWDCLAFVLSHEERHIQQIKEIEEELIFQK